MTLSSPIFRKLLTSAFLLIAVTLLVLDFYLTRYTTRHEIAHVEEQLESEARILSSELGKVSRDQLEPWSREAGERAGVRLTLINPEGVVLADSEHDPESMENHSRRPEIQDAVRNGVGSSTRHSATLNRDLCYLALRVNYGGETGSVLRLAVPLQAVDAAITAVRWRIFAASLAAALVALAVAYLFSRSFTARLARLQAVAEGLVEVPAPRRAQPVEGEDELGALTRSLHETGTRLRDLVERLKLESAQREAILASMVEGVLAVDGELRITFCNESFGRAVGATAGLPELRPLVHWVRDPGLMAMLKRVLGTGETLQQRLQLSVAEEKTFEVQAAPLASPSGRGAIAILHDITHLERLERVRKDFVANVSHELRTPLTAIRGYAETLLEGALEDPENNRRFLEIIKSHAIRLNHIASDLLLLSELESPQPPSEPELFPVQEALDAALRTVEPEARRRGVKLWRGAIDDATVRADRGRLEQAIVNLLDNAVKFSRDGGEVRVEAERTRGDKVRIAISDTGMGIPSQDLPRIFERFYRVDKARSRSAGGTGLGLSIVKHIVERMNGTVMVESQLGKGSTFTIFLANG